MKLIVGIDFGTSTTVVRYRMEDSDVIYSLKDPSGNSDIFPTVIFKYSDFDATEYGGQALVSANSGMKGDLIENFKMDLLDPEKRKEAQNYIIEFLTFIRKRFEEQTMGFNPSSTEIYISYPSKWKGTELVDIMINAVESAGFNGIIKGKIEPKAAVHNMLNNHLKELQRAKLLGTNKPLRIFLLDMGAGTTDIIIFKLTIDDEGIPQISEPLSYPSNSEKFLCGGREIDDALQSYIKGYCEKGGLEYLDPEAIKTFNIKTWKDSMVSPRLTKELPISLLPGVSLILRSKNRNDLIDNFHIGRMDFELATKDHWKKLYSLIKSAMAQYKYAKPEDIDFVCLTGGHSAWYTIPKLFNGEGVCDYIAKDGKDPDALNFKKLKDEPCRWKVVLDALPHESVARGLCLTDQRMIYVTPSSNNVWARLTINDEPGEIVQVINKLDDVLPVVNREVSHAKDIERNIFLNNRNIDVQIDLYVGETLENSEHRVLKLNQKVMSIIGVLVTALFPLSNLFWLFVKMPFHITVAMDVTMTDEGLLEINGRFAIDDNSPITFTYDDLCVVQ